MDIKSKALTYLKMFVLMGFAVFVSGILKQEIFINDSPTIRPHVGSYLLARIQGVGSSGQSMFAFLKGSKAQDEELGKSINTQVAQRLQNIPLKAVSKGVYAKEDDKIKYTEIHESEVTWRVYTINIKGKDVTIKVPSDSPKFTPQQVQSLLGDQ